MKKNQTLLFDKKNIQTKEIMDERPNIVRKWKKLYLWKAKRELNITHMFDFVDIEPNAILTVSTNPIMWKIVEFAKNTSLVIGNALQAFGLVFQGKYQS